MYGFAVASLFVIRHGQASYGEADYDRLSPRGREQATALGPRLAQLKLDAIFVGPLVRQQQTYEGAAAAANLPPPTTLLGLAEYPAFEMLQHFIPRLTAEDPRFAELTTAPTPRLLDDAFQTVLDRWGRDDWHAPGVERVEAFVARVRDALDRMIRAAASGARIAAITSAGPIGVALGLALELPVARMVRSSVVIRNASITELRFRTDGFAWRPDQLSLVTFNSTDHLPATLVSER